MGGGVAVAAHNGHAGQGEALLGTHDVNDALTHVEFGIIFDAEFRRVLGQCVDLQGRFRIIDAVTAVGGRNVVVDHGKRLLRLAHLAAGHAQAFECLRAGNFMHQVAIDVEQPGSVRLHVDHVVVPDLVVKRPCLGHGSLLGPSEQTVKRSKVCEMPGDARRGASSRKGLSSFIVASE